MGVARQRQLLHELTKPLLSSKRTTVAMVTTNHGSWGFRDYTSVNDIPFMHNYTQTIVGSNYSCT